MLEQTKKLGWHAVELGLIIVAIAVLLNIIVGEQAGSYVATVSQNALAFLQALPPGIAVGMSLILLIYTLANRTWR